MFSVLSNIMPWCIYISVMKNDLSDYMTMLTYLVLAEYICHAAAVSM